MGKDKGVQRKFSNADKYFNISVKTTPKPQIHAVSKTRFWEKIFLKIKGQEKPKIFFHLTYEQFSVAAAQKCSNTTKMGFCKCRH